MVPVKSPIPKFSVHGGNGGHVEWFCSKRPDSEILAELAIICWDNSRRIGGFVRPCRRARERSHRCIPPMYLRRASVSWPIKTCVTFYQLVSGATLNKCRVHVVNGRAAGRVYLAVPSEAVIALQVCGDYNRNILKSFHTMRTGTKWIAKPPETVFACDVHMLLRIEHARKAE